MATWQVAHKGTVYPLAVAPNSATADIDATIKSMIGYAGNDMQYELADGTRVVLSSTLPDGIEVHCKPACTAAQHVRDGEGMRLHIKTLTGKSTYVTVSKDATLDDLKAAVEAQDGARQTLLYRCHYARGAGPVATLGR